MSSYVYICLRELKGSLANAPVAQRRLATERIESEREFGFARSPSWRTIVPMEKCSDGLELSPPPRAMHAPIVLHINNPTGASWLQRSRHVENQRLIQVGNFLFEANRFVQCQKNGPGCSTVPFRRAAGGHSAR